VDWDTLPARELIRFCVESPTTSAWREFIRRYHLIFESAAFRVARQWGHNSRDEIEDILQEIYLKLCHDRAAILTSFGDHRDEAIYGYLKVISTNTALDYFRAKATKKRGNSITGALAEVSEAAFAESHNELERKLIVKKVEEIMLRQTQGQNGARDRAIFWFSYRYGLTAKAIASLPEIDLTPKGVEGVIHRLTGSIREQLDSVQGKRKN
jgi:RNA polymerase sigma factor (sigma-70 family)